MQLTTRRCLIRKSTKRTPHARNSFVDCLGQTISLSLLEPEKKNHYVHRSISMHILHTVLYTIRKLLTRRICCLTNQLYFLGLHLNDLFRFLVHLLL